MIGSVIGEGSGEEVLEDVVWTVEIGRREVAGRRRRRRRRAVDRVECRLMMMMIGGGGGGGDGDVHVVERGEVNVLPNLFHGSSSCSSTG